MTIYDSSTRTYKLLDIITVVSITLLLLSNIIASKLVNWIGITGPAAMYLFPITYIFGDIIVEVYGYQRSRRIIWLGFVANIIMALVFWYAIALPFPDYYKGQEAFSSVLGLVPRTVVFSIIGYWVGSFVNAVVMAKMKEWMIKWDPNSKWLFLRTIGSTIVGELADSLIFILGVFLGVFPWGVVSTMIVTQWIVKCAVEAVMTPVTYVVTNKLKKIEGVDVVGADTYSPFKMKIS